MSRNETQVEMKRVAFDETGDEHENAMSLASAVMEMASSLGEAMDNASHAGVCEGCFYTAISVMAACAAHKARNPKDDPKPETVEDFAKVIERGMKTQMAGWAAEEAAEEAAKAGHHH
jgi:hypothetical protein